ncbi:MAG: glycosyltransferase family 4 protein [candidate division FCPU426 bacterium]
MPAKKAKCDALTPPRKKIAILVTRMSLGGAQQVAFETALRLDPARFETYLISGSGGVLDPVAEKAMGSRFVRIPSFKHFISPFHDLAAFFSLWAFFLRVKPDLVHTHSSKAGLLGRMAARLAGVRRVVHTVHGWSFNDFMQDPGRRAYIWLERMMAPWTSKLVVVAQSGKDKGLLNHIGREEQYVLIRAGVDLTLWSKAKRGRQDLNKKLAALKIPAIKTDEKVVGCIANCKPQKNPLDFVRVASKVLKRAPRTRFVYVGEGPLQAEAQNLASSLGIASKVHFLGFSDAPLPLARGFDMFLLTSLWEGLPCVFSQALSLGLPVVATNVDGAPEIIDEGVNGYLCQPHDVEALADRVTALVAKPELMRRLSAAAKKSVGKEFSFEAMALRSAEVYESLCAF